MGDALELSYVYRRPSALSDAGTLRLEASSVADVDEPFLRARALRPTVVASALRSVSDVVQSRHFVPPAMLEKILRAADPVLHSPREAHPP